jgi:hypothetical protein
MKKKLRIISSGNLAFVIVVAASYVSAVTALVYAHRAVPPWQVVVMISAALAYLVVGTVSRIGETLAQGSLLRGANPACRSPHQTSRARRRAVSHPVAAGRAKCSAAAVALDDSGLQHDLSADGVSPDPNQSLA